MSAPAISLLSSADNWARDILMDAYDSTTTDHLVQGWARVMQAAANAWEAVASSPASAPDAIPSGYPLDALAAIADWIVSDAGWRQAEPEPRTQRVLELVDMAAQVVNKDPSRADLADQNQQTARGDIRVGLLHISYLLTHAAAISTTHHARLLSGDDPLRSAEMATLSARIAGVEQVLDLHLHPQPSLNTVPREIGSLDQALNHLLTEARSVSEAVRPANSLVLADIARDITGNTARLAVQAANHGMASATGVRDRMLPALQTSIQQWEQTRSIWVRLLAPTDRPDRRITTAGNQLQKLLRDPDLAKHPQINTTLNSALNAAVELASINQQALTSPHLQAPAGAVYKMTREAIGNHPNPWKELTSWLATNPVDGPRVVPIPKPLQTELAQLGKTTVESTLIARSSGHALVNHRGYNPTLALRQGQSNPARRPPDPPSSRQSGVDGPRIN